MNTRIGGCVSRMLSFFQDTMGGMARFSVTAVTKEGTTYTEDITAPDRFEVYREIRERGDTITTIHDSQKKGLFSLAKIDEFLTSVSLDEKVIFAKNLSAMIDAGLTTSRALGVMERQTKNKKLKSVLRSLQAEVERGSPLSSGLLRFPKVFSPLMISMVRAGEESGQLSESLRVVSLQMDSANRLRKRIRGALMYPSIILVAMVGIAILMLMFVVPTLSQTFAELGTELPPTTRAIIFASDSLATHPLLTLLGLLAIGGAVFYSLRTPVGRRCFEWTMLRVPVIGALVRETQSAQTMRTLSSLLSAGVDMVLALSITRDVVQNSFFKEVLRGAEEAVTTGSPLFEVFQKNQHLYPPLVSEMIAVGEETGKLSPLLKETAIFYEETVEQKTKDLSTIIEPFLMLIIGAGVGFFALAMIAPIYGISNSL